MDSPPSNAEVNAHNSSVRNLDKNDGSILSEIPTQYPIGAAVVPSTPDNQAFMVEDRSRRCEAMGVASVPSPPNYQSSMADCHPQTSQPLGVISSNSPPNIHSITTGRDQQQLSRPMDMASNQSPANYASFTQFSQPKSKGIIIISILHFVGGLLTCGLGIALYFLWRSNDSRFYLHMGFIGHTILFFAAGITGLCNGVKKSSSRCLVLNMVMNIFVPFAALRGIHEACSGYFYFLQGSTFQLKVPFLVVTTLRLIVFICELFCGIVGSSLLYHRLYDVPQRTYMTQKGVNSGNRNGGRQTEAETFYMPSGQPASSTGEYIPLQLTN